MHQDFLRNLNNEKQAKKKIVKGMYPNESSDVNEYESHD